MKLPTEIKAIITDMVHGIQHYDKYRPALEALGLVRRLHHKSTNEYTGNPIDIIWIRSWHLALERQYYLKLNGDRFWKFEYIYENGQRIQSCYDPWPLRG